MIRQKSKQFFKHLLMPIIGFIIIAYVLYGMDMAAIKIGSTWIGIGIVYLLVLTFVIKAKPTKLDL